MEYPRIVFVKIVKAAKAPDSTQQQLPVDEQSADVCVTSAQLDSANGAVTDDIANGLLVDAAPAADEQLPLPAADGVASGAHAEAAPKTDVPVAPAAAASVLVPSRTPSAGNKKVAGGSKRASHVSCAFIAALANALS